MKKLLIGVLVFGVLALGGVKARDWHQQRVLNVYYVGLSDGMNAGEVRGIFTCPCWDREGSFCSLCGVRLTEANIDRIISGN
jgi:hypothetical protein